MGYLSRSAFAPELADAVFSLQPGAFSDMLTSSQGIHFFKVLNKRAAESLSLDESREQIREYLKQQHQRIERSKIVEGLVGQAVITKP